MKNDFYSSLEPVFDSLTSSDVKIVLADFNASNEQIQLGTTGGRSRTIMEADPQNPNERQ